MATVSRVIEKALYGAFADVLREIGENPEHSPESQRAMVSYRIDPETRPHVQPRRDRRFGLLHVVGPTAADRAVSDFRAAADAVIEAVAAMQVEVERIRRELQAAAESRRAEWRERDAIEADAEPAAVAG